MLTRFVNLQDAQKAREKQDGDLVIDMAFSSEEPYERWWGIEILDHSEKSVRLSRLNDGAALLFNHNPNELRGAHVRNSVRLDSDRVMRGKVRVTSATQTGRDTIGLVDSGVLSKASIGYRIHNIIEQTTKKNGEKLERLLDGALFERVLTRSDEQHRGDLAAFRSALDAAAGPFERASDEPTVYRIVDWEPFESSLVTIPADPTVGIGRNHSEEYEARMVRASETADAAEEKLHMADKPTAAAGDIADKDKNLKPDKIEVRAADPSPSALELEKSRQRAIDNLCKANKLDEKYRDMWVGRGSSIEEVSEDILKILEERGKTSPQPATLLGMSRGEANRFSFMRAIRAIADNDWKHAGFELECSRAVAQKRGIAPDPKKFYVPFEVMQRDVGEMPQTLKRDLTVGTAGAGGYLVSTENLGFIEMVRNRSVMFRMGARRLSGLQGSVTIPRQSAAATAYWLSTEATQITESQQTFVQMALSPKNVGAYTEISRQLLLQSSPGAEGIVTDDLAQVVALAIDLAGLEGSGSGGQPTGIANTSGIGSVTGTSLPYAGILEFQTDVATANVTPMAGGYATTPAVAALLMQRARFSNTDTPLWAGNIWNGQVSGFPGMSSNQLTAASMIFGDWQEAVIAEWGVLEVEVNPYANFQAGIIGVRAIYSMDVGVRRPFAFSRSTSIT
jgi:HK97 family phage major capsid protein